MTTTKNSNFIAQKIRNTGTAIFFDFSESILKFPPNVITIQDIDKSGNIMFYIKKPYEDISGFDRYFFGELQFYNKNYGDHITVQGKGTIVLQDNEKHGEQWSDKLTTGKEILISFRIIKAEYWRSWRYEKHGLGYYLNKFKNWLLYDEKQQHTLTYQFSR